MQIKLAIRMALIVGTDFICWMPIIIMGLLSASGAVEIPADVYAWTAVFILPLNSSLNPYLYTFSVAWQRKKARKKSSIHTASESLQDTSKHQIMLHASIPINHNYSLYIFVIIYNYILGYILTNRMHLNSTRRCSHQKYHRNIILS